MKTTFYIFLLICSSVFVTAQVHVTPPDGNVGIGTETPTGKLTVKSLSNKIGMECRSPHGNTHLPHSNGWSYISGKGVILRTNVNKERMRILSNGRVGIGLTNPSQKLHVVGSIAYTGSLVNVSDKRLKQNESKFDYGLNEVLTLSPIYYSYNGKAGTKAEQTHVGIYAQDLKKAAPKLVGEFIYQEVKVVEDDEGLEFTEKTKAPETYLNINESAIKYMLINAVKEQQETIEELKKEVAELRDIVENGGSRTGNSRQSIELNDRKPTLKQNSPNPFSSSTLIEYYVPTDADKAVVNIHDITGMLIHSESIRSMGEGRVQIEAGTIPAGTYNYSLVVNGKVLDTKQMIIAK